MFDVGAKAPSFTAVDQDGNKVSLKDFAGKWLILYFYPKDLTPGCTTQACDFRDAAKELKKLGFTVIGVSKDDSERHQKFRAKHELNFTLLADTDGKLCERYGVWREKTLYGKKSLGIVRTTYVINPEQKFELVYNNVRATGHVERLLNDIRNVCNS